MDKQTENQNASSQFLGADGEETKSNTIEVPSISLPKGGGAIKGIGEKFAANPVTGTGSMTIPIATTEGRGGFSPELSLSYDSGSGNGIFGLGWHLSLPAISRKTDKGLPQYFDSEESDTFILSGAEDLVPVDNSEFEVTDTEYTIEQYRPRIEGLFARIEKWTKDEDVYWRAITKENITSIYGKDTNSRISNPDPENPSQIFSWLLCESYDDKGNVVIYEYQEEDSQSVDSSPMYEKNRNSVNRYIKTIKYGNQISRLVNPNPTDWHFEVKFDYDESIRQDPFSSHRSGFEVRTYRLCHSVKMYHNFEELGAEPCLVSSTAFTYEQNPIASFITKVTQSGHQGTDKKSLPPLDFEYSKAIISKTIEQIDQESLENLPIGVDGSQYRWVDLDGEGLSGVLTEQGDSWYYKPNLGGKLGMITRVSSIPSTANLNGGKQQLLDLDGNGEIELVAFDSNTSGFYERDSDSNQWKNFIPFRSKPNINWNDPNLKFIDLTGDGHADILISEDDVFTWYPSLKQDGFDTAQKTNKLFDEEKGPALVFADTTQSVYLADISGDGLNDIVRLRNGEVCYWSNLGYSRFGQKVTMKNSPWFDHPDQFNQNYIRMADIDGSGVTDIIYLGHGKVSIYFNHSGNSWSDKQTLENFPLIDNLSSVNLVDIKGNGTACLVWSSPLIGKNAQQLSYIDLMSGKKPHLLTMMKNNLGAETRIHYTASTKFYLEDKLNGKPWITKLPFPVHVVERVETYDRISKNRFVSRYAYHHGYFDGYEREFRGFGMVEQWDSDEIGTVDFDQISSDTTNLEQSSYVPPVYTKTWFHTGAYIKGKKISKQFEKEYFPEGSSSEEVYLDDTVLPPEIETGESDTLFIPQELKEACRALKGSVLRQEVYALDNSDKSEIPYTVTESNHKIKFLQSKGENKHAVFLTYPLESISYHYERNTKDPRISHNVTLDVDQYGNVLKSAQIVYGRQIVTDESLRAKQDQIFIVYSVNSFTNAIYQKDAYLIPLPCESKSYEVTGLSIQAGKNRFSLKKILDETDNAREIGYESTLSLVETQKRLLSHSRILYLKNDLLTALALGEVDSLALSYESYRLALTPSLVNHIYENKVTNKLLEDSGYVHSEDTNWWIPSGRMLYAADAEQHFYLPKGSKDPFGNESYVEYDNYRISILKTIDALDNEVTAKYDYRVMQPSLMTDQNGNNQAVEFDALGMVVGTAAEGRIGENKGDSLKGFQVNLSDTEINACIANPFDKAHTILGDATTRLVYDLNRYQETCESDTPQPAVVYTLSRETHQDPNTKIQHSFLYSDGFGREIQTKIQAESKRGETKPRWVGSGRTIYNNKGKPIKQYEPFFSPTHLYEGKKEVTDKGVTKILFYDPLDRVVAILHPNHTFEKVVFDPWKQISYDVNDTIEINPVEDPDVGGFFKRLEDSEYLPKWGGKYDASHADTPSIAYLDSLGRIFLTVEDNGNEQKFKTQLDMDIEGNQLSIIDARGNTVMRYLYDMQPPKEDEEGEEQKESLYQNSMDAGERWSVENVMGSPIKEFDSRKHVFTFTYDELHRPISKHVKGGDLGQTLNHTFEKIMYGDFKDITEAERTENRNKNLIGQPIAHHDTAGKVTFKEYDFKGNLLESHRRLTEEYKKMADWCIADKDSLLEDESFTTLTEYDALNRIKQSTTPDKSITFPQYNEANLLDSIWIKQKNDDKAKEYVKNIDYDAKGQRERIRYGNDVTTTYSYEKETFRLVNLLTEKGNKKLQDLHYAYDPTGNITEIEDKSILTEYYKNCVIEPKSTYTYDPLYRLKSATGREHSGKLTFGKNDNWNDKPFMTKDPHNCRDYEQLYHYDQVGNIEQMKHSANGGSWTREYEYEYDNNRLKNTKVGTNNTNQTYTYHHHPTHGFITKMPHLQKMEWDHLDQLHAIQRGTTEAWYQYDASGERVRKVVSKDGQLEERIYLDGCEIYRKYSGNNVSLERETLHIMDDKQRIAMIETRTKGDDGSQEQLIRYQLGNHLGSVSLELDVDAQMISYEEYHPYGTTAYQLNSKTIKAVAKRYRYTGMERDDETGLNYHSARYYMPWLGRWLSCDPIGIGDGLNLYIYSHANPKLWMDVNGKKASKKNICTIKIGMKQQNYPKTLSISPVLVKKLFQLQQDIDKKPKYNKIRERSALILRNEKLLVLTKDTHMKLVADATGEAPNIDIKLEYFDYIKKMYMLSPYYSFRPNKEYNRESVEIDVHTHPDFPTPSLMDIALNVVGQKEHSKYFKKETNAHLKSMVVAPNKIYLMVSSRKSLKLRKEKWVGYHTMHNYLFSIAKKFPSTGNLVHDAEVQHLGAANKVGLVIYILNKGSERFKRYEGSKKMK